MEDKIIELETKRTIEQNLASIGAEYFKTVKHSLPIIGTVDEITGYIILVANQSVQNELMQVVNLINQRSIVK